MRHRLLFLLFAATMVLPSLAQPDAGAPLNSTDAKGRKQGGWSKTWPNGKTRYLGQFKDDMRFIYLSWDAAKPAQAKGVTRIKTFRPSKAKIPMVL